MPSKLNSEFNYRYQVQGETIWEKIKTLKGFLEGRRHAGEMQKISLLRYKSKLALLKHLTVTNAPEHEILSLEADILEIQSNQLIEQQAFELNHQEIKILENLLKECYTLAEPTRILNYTDEQMFEANAANEFTVAIGKEIYAEIIANGRPSPARIRNAMSNPVTWSALQQIGLIPKENSLLVASNNPLQIGFTDSL